MEQVIVALVTIIPATLVGLAGWRSSKATRDIVTGNGHGNVAAMAEEGNTLLGQVLGQLDSVLRWQGAHAAEHTRNWDERASDRAEDRARHDDERIADRTEHADERDADRQDHETHIQEYRYDRLSDLASPTGKDRRGQNRRAR